MRGASSILDARLMLITDTTLVPMGVLAGHVERILSAACPGSVIVQLRDLDLPVRARLVLGRSLLAACRRHNQWLIVNDRCDVAMLLGADGVHLGERSIEAMDARRLLGPEAFISCASHEAARAAPIGADAVVLSPIFALRKGRKALGLPALRKARATFDAQTETVHPVKLYALGGVDAHSATGALSAGADGVAAIGAAFDGRDPSALLQALSIAR